MKTFLVKNGDLKYFVTCHQTDLPVKVVNDFSPHEALRVDNLMCIYDNGGKTLDRITVVLLNEFRKKPGDRLRTYECIASSDTGEGFYNHSECMRGPHLGKKISFSELSAQLKSKLINEF